MDKEKFIPPESKIKLFKAAAIRREYFYIGMDDVVFDDDSVEHDIKMFYENLDKAVTHGLGLFLTGDYGQGKTLIASLILKRAIKYDFAAYFMSMFDFVDYYGGWDEKARQMRDWLRRVHVLVIDDVGAESVKARDYTFSLLDNLIVERQGATILTSNKSKEQLKATYGEHLLEFVGTNKIREVLIDAGKSMRHQTAWEDLLNGDTNREPQW